MGIVYLAAHRESGKAYVGITTKTLRFRLVCHIQRARLGYRSYFYDAIRAHGFESFDYAVLETCETKPELEAREKYWIEHLGSRPPHGYNLTAGGQGTADVPKTALWYAAHTNEAYRLKKSIQTKAWRALQTAEERAEHSRKVGDGNRGKPNLKNRGDGNPAKKPESRVKISAGLQRSWQDPEVRKRRAAAWAASRERKRAST